MKHFYSLDTEGVRDLSPYEFSVMLNKIGFVANLLSPYGSDDASGDNTRDARSEESLRIFEKNKAKYEQLLKRKEKG